MVEREMSETPKSLVPAQGGAELAEWRHSVPTTAQDAASSEVLPDESLKKYSVAGWLILAIFFGGFGAWAATAPLNGAVVAEAVVKVEGNRKSVQHLDGGIVKEMKVKEGDRVKGGDVLIVLDDVQARSDFDVFSQQQMVLRATEARLKGELDRAASITAPAEIASKMNDPEMRTIWTAQQQQFQSRRAALEGERQVLREKINQLREQIAGNEQEVASFRQQIDSVRKELTDITPLVEKGLITQPRRLQLERTAFGLEGQIAATTAEIARARQAIAEQTQQIAQLDHQRMTEVTKDLRDTQAALLEVTPRVTNARSSLGRMDITSPYSGQVVGLNIFAKGAVIRPGETILDIVPDDDALTIEAKVAVEDISDVHPDTVAEVHLTAYKQRIIPMVHGTVTQVSADRLTDERTGVPYYTALVRINRDELAELPNVRLYPGMPAQVMIPTVERTALDYLLGPLVQSFNTAFRQR
jgi:HlyD family type I secretion membrane fusion protein